MRDGAEMTENGMVLKPKDTSTEDQVREELKGSVAGRRAQMTKELIGSVIATAIVGVVAYAFVEMEVHTWKLGVVKAGSYLWAIIITIGIFAAGGIFYALFSKIGAANGAGFDRVMKSVRDATEGTVQQLKENFSEKPLARHARHPDLRQADLLRLPHVRPMRSVFGPTPASASSAP